MFALADINSFYASCEKVFRPDLRNEPVIVLSNNDGCVIARSPEAKALGIRMGQPWFQVRKMRLEKKIHVFSSNYALYHSMSQRVMAVLESLSPAVEPYSIDEMFIDLRGVNRCISPEVFGHQLREQVKSWTGLTMGVGIAPTKTLAKSAQWATKQWPQFSGVVALTAENRNRICKLLGLQPVGEVWGVGRRETTWGASVLPAGGDIYTNVTLCSESPLLQQFRCGKASIAHTGQPGHYCRSMQSVKPCLA